MRGATTSALQSVTLKAEARHGPGLFRQRTAFVRGEGARLFSESGRAYLDFMGGIGVASLGHAHPRLAAAVAKQASQLVVCPQSQANPTRAALLERLLGLANTGRSADAPLTRVFLSSSGTEANEAAIKWALAATGRRRLVAAKRGFAGRTLGSLATTWAAAYRVPFGVAAVDVEFVTFGDAQALEAALSSDVAAVLLEPVQGEGGVHPAPPGYLARARALTREHGVLLVLDEVQTGVGRTGTFLASQEGGATADIVTLAKGLAGGVPIGATLMTDEVATAMPRGGHGSTFGGNPLACAAALAVLDEIEEADLLSNVRAVGARLQQGISRIGSRRVREVRGRGLLVGIELRERAGPLVGALWERGLLTVSAGPNVIRLLPPLNVSVGEVDEALDLLAAELK